ncbi:MAG: ATP-binding protein [Actinobacteria bacterium]|nr:ATP-binding protein [Actinomycetota bacterium]MBV9254109.1 ATP-binding protein [Actinomycetota bacterium]MBV9665107.1 ATP-binding protein [Actinomycetota bacterium]MBV9936672.1 ATP-binding protein [Actinomycetota bacterium]
MQISLALNLPRDAATIPVARHIARDALREVGVTDECSMAIEVALTEAATNVVKHSGPGDAYEVGMTLSGDHCTIRVVDTGRGFDFSSLAGLASDLSAERGRGMELMHALVDQVTFESKPEAGTIVHLEKQLQLLDASPLQRFGVGMNDGLSR